MTLDQLNNLQKQAFTDALAGIFEHSPWVPERAWPQRPFASVEALHAAMCAVVADASVDEQMALIRAHPQLAGNAARRNSLASPRSTTPIRTVSGFPSSSPCAGIHGKASSPTWTGA